MANTGDQLPGCALPRNCLSPSGEMFCGTDLGCLCKSESTSSTSRLFSSECVLKECADEQGRKAFLRDWLESCRRVGKSGWDYIPKDLWEPYSPKDGDGDVLPTAPVSKPAYSAPTSSPHLSIVTSTDAVATSLVVASSSTLLTTPSSVKITTSAIITTSTTDKSGPTTKNSVASTRSDKTSVASTSSIQETTSAASQPIIVGSQSLSPGAVAGIIVGIFVLVLICAGLGYFYWKANKRAKQKSREVAILSDRVSGCGFQRYIDELLDDNRSAAGSVMRHDVPGTEKDLLSAGVRDKTGSAKSMDIARAI